jgi:hypothetical protein
VRDRLGYVVRVPLTTCRDFMNVRDDHHESNIVSRGRKPRSP